MDDHLTLRQKKLVQEFKKVAQDFFQRESSGDSMITVTSVDYSADMHNAKVFITALPESKEQSALNFAKRQMGDLREDLKKKMSLRVLPHLEVELDYGEKNRQHIESLLNVDKK